MWLTQTYIEIAAGFQIHFRCAVLGEPIVREYLLALVACFVSTTLLVADTPEPAFRAGAATSNITPALGSAIIGSSPPIPAANVHDGLPDTNNALAQDAQNHPTVGPDKTRAAHDWLASTFEGNETFFSFLYGGEPFATLRNDWKLERATRKLDESRSERVLTYTDPKTGLVVRCVGIEYLDFPTVEWTLHFKNSGDADTPILEDIRALDIEVVRSPRGGHEGEDKDFCLHHYVGGECSPHAYQPLTTVLSPGTQIRFSGTSGRPTDKQMPYFNLQRPENAGGLIVVVGWPGQWAADFTRVSDTRLHLRAGQELTHFKLLPGEEVRSPLIVLQFWKGDRVESQNVWRRWMLAHNLPRPGGKLPEPILAFGPGGLYPGIITNAAGEVEFIRRTLERNFKPDYWWQDAGWYPCDNRWPKTGTWEVDKTRFPKGYREVSDLVHAKGMKSLLWFEPERVAADTWLAKERPQWVLGGEKGGILNLGNPEAWNWLVERVDTLLVEQGIDLYRQDFNTGPLALWRANDAEDRQGITEIKHVTGYLAYWDELRRRHPNMLIDTCASGGRRNDLETLRRSVPLLRSDLFGEENSGVPQECQTYGIAAWFPYYGTNTQRGPVVNSYAFRGRMCPCATIAKCDTRREDIDYPELHRLVGQWRQVAPYYFGDYYPLTGYSLEEDVWMAWQFNRPDLGAGVVQVFRRSKSPVEAARFQLRGLDPDATYAIVNLDTPNQKTTVTGRELLETGLRVAISNRPEAVIYTYTVCADLQRNRVQESVSGRRGTAPAAVIARSRPSR